MENIERAKMENIIKEINDLDICLKNMKQNITIEMLNLKAIQVMYENVQNKKDEKVLSLIKKNNIL